MKKELSTNKVDSNILADIAHSIERLKQKNYSYEKTLEIVNNLISKQFKGKKEVVFLPVSIFDNDKLTPKEIIVRYLKENLNLKYKDIAKLLKRNTIPINNCYNRAIKKYHKKIVAKESKYIIPNSVFTNELSIFEAIVSYMKDSLKLRYHDIAILLKRNDRTIWTVYHRAKKKNARQ